MFWLYPALIGMAIWSVTAIVDRFALNERIKSMRFYVVVPALLQFPLVLVLYPLFAPTTFDTHVVAISLLGGALEVAMLYYLFVAFSAEEIGRVFPLMSLGSVMTLAGGWLFLGDTLDGRELAAFALLVSGGFIVALKRDAKRVKFTRAIVPILIACGLGSAYSLTLRWAFIESDFATGFFFSRIGFFLGGAIVLVVWYSEIKRQWSTLRTRLRTLIIGNQIVVFSGHTFYFSALALVNAALVGSVLSIQGILIFAMASVISFFNPNLVNESITKADLTQKITGIALIVLGLNLLL